MKKQNIITTFSSPVGWANFSDGERRAQDMRMQVSAASVLFPEVKDRLRTFAFVKKKNFKFIT